MTRTEQLTEPALNLQLANCKASTGAHTSGEARRGRCKKKRGLQKGKPEQRWPAGKEEAGGLTPRGTSLAGRYLRVVGVGVVVPPGGVQREDSTSGSQASPQGWPEGHTPTKSLPGPQQLARSPTKVPCNLYALSPTSQHRVPLTSPNKPHASVLECNVRPSTKRLSGQGQPGWVSQLCDAGCLPCGVLTMDL